MLQNHGTIEKAIKVGTNILEGAMEVAVGITDIIKGVASEIKKITTGIKKTPSNDGE